MQPATLSQMNIRQLAQLRPANTSTASLLATLDKSKYVVYSIIICNTTGSAANASIFLDADGTTYSADTALISVKSIAANDYLLVEFREGIAVQNSGSIGCQSGTGDALNFTVNGVELGSSGSGF